MKIVNTDAGVGVVDDDQVEIRWPDEESFYGNADPTPGPVLALSTVRLLAPSTRPDKIICVGLNFRRHAEEAGLPVPEHPVLFPKFANSIVGDGAVVDGSASSQLDYEAELAVVIGSRCSKVGIGAALDHVAGFTCANDLSARDLQFLTSQWLLGKAIDGYLPLGPCLVTPDEVGDPQDLQMQCWVNGELRQAESTADMIFGVAEIISFVSRTCTLMPGDVIITGTPYGVGMGFNPPRWLADGDEVVVQIDRIGRLVTTIGH